MKIVQRITALMIAGAIGVSMISCGNKNVQDYKNDELKTQQSASSNNQGDLNNKNEINVNNNSSSSNNANKKENIETYQPLDFKSVTDYAAKYDELMQQRDAYNSQMKKVIRLNLFYSEEEIALAIYNVVRIDSDLSNLIIKISAKKQKEIQDMVYLADQIETLEKVYNSMQNLIQQIESSQNDYESGLKNISKADATQIEKVYKLSITPLNVQMKKLEKEINSLKIELENTLAQQP